MKLPRFLVAVSAATALAFGLAPTVTLAQTQPIPTAIAPDGRPINSAPASIVVAPSGGVGGKGKVVAGDYGLPVNCITGCTGGGGGGAVTAALNAYVDGSIVTFGALADGACSTDNGSCSAQALAKRSNQRLTSILTALGSPMQAGGSVSLSGTLPGFAATPTFNIGTTAGLALNSTFTAQQYTAGSATGVNMFIRDLTGALVDPNAASTVKGTIPVGSNATDAPVYLGCRGTTANPAVVTDGQIVALRCGPDGKLTTAPFQPRSLMDDAGTPVVVTTSSTTIYAAQAGISADMVSIQITNDSGTALSCDIFSNGVKRAHWQVPANDNAGMPYSTPLKANAANTAWTATCTASATMQAQFAKNQ